MRRLDMAQPGILYTVFSTGGHGDRLMFGSTSSFIVYLSRDTSL